MGTSTSTITEDGEMSPGTTVVDPEKGEGDRKEQSRHNSELDLAQVNLSLRDLNPLTPLWLGLRRMNNLTILIASGKITSYVEHVEKPEVVAQDSYLDSVT